MKTLTQQIREHQMKGLGSIVKENVNASNLEQNFKNFDFGIITAWRDDDGCGDGTPTPLSKKRSDNKALQSALNRYTVIQGKGVYIENYGTPDAKQVLEDVFVVFDVKNSGSLERDIKKLGAKYNQDSVLVGKAGKSAELIGTSKCPNAYIKFGSKEKLGTAKFGKKGEFYTTVNNKPFTF